MSQAEAIRMILTLQYLRALAAMAVVLSHLSFKSAVVGADLLEGARIGAAGVDVFFVISGFVMAMIHNRTAHGFGPALEFWKKRVIRIVPMYWFVTTAALVLYLINPALVNAHSGPTSLWRSYTLIPTLQQSEVQFLIGPGWTLSFELFFYLIFTLIFLIPGRSMGLFVASGLLAGLACGSLSGVATTYLLTSPLLIEFAFGIAVFAWFERSGGRLPLLPGLFCMATAVAGFAMLDPAHDFVFDVRWWRVGIPAALLVIGALALEPRASARPSRLWRMIGDSSYSLYLTHIFVVGAASRGFSFMGFRRYGAPFEVGYWLLTFVVAVAAGYVAYRCIERPLTRWAARMWLRGRHQGSEGRAAEPASV